MQTTATLERTVAITPRPVAREPQAGTVQAQDRPQVTVAGRAAKVLATVVGYLTATDFPSATGDVLKEYPTLGLLEKRYW